MLNISFIKYLIFLIKDNILYIFFWQQNLEAVYNFLKNRFKSKKISKASFHFSYYLFTIRKICKTEAALQASAYITGIRTAVYDNALRIEACRFEGIVQRFPIISMSTM